MVLGSRVGVVNKQFIFNALRLNWPAGRWRGRLSRLSLIHRAPAFDGCDGGQILCLWALNDALQREALMLVASIGNNSAPVWRLIMPYLHLALQGAGGRAGSHIHRPLKKSAFLAIFAFDTAEPRTYNPRPRCFAADVANAVLSLKSDVKIVSRRRCLTL
jgi:hypothetical protein